MKKIDWDAFYQGATSVYPSEPLLIPHRLVFKFLKRNQPIWTMKRFFVASITLSMKLTSSKQSWSVLTATVNIPLRKAFPTCF